MKTTLNAIRAHHPCTSGWTKLLRHLGKTQADDEPLSITTILDSNGLSDALWCLRSVKGHDREIRLYAVWCARQDQCLMTDALSLAAIEVSERYANNLASKYELAVARAAAVDVARNVASIAVLVYVQSVAWDVALASALGVAGAAARAAAWDAARAAQVARLREVCAEIEAAEVAQ